MAQNNIHEEASNCEATSGQNLPPEMKMNKLVYDLKHHAHASQYSKNLDYIDLLEYSVPCDLFAFTDDHAVRDVQ